MQLILIRHAPAHDKKQFAKTGKNDALRPLTNEGRKVITRVAKNLKKIIPHFDVLATSPWTRATETTEILSRFYTPSVVRDKRTKGNDAKMTQTKELIPNKNFASFLKWVASLNTKNKSKMEEFVVACVGHEPHLSKLAGFLLTGQKKSFVEFKKAGVCVMELKKMKPGKATLQLLLPPISSPSPSRGEG